MQVITMIFCLVLLFSSLSIARPSNNASVDVVGGDEPCAEGTNVGEGVENQEQQCRTVEKNAVVIDKDGSQVFANGIHAFTTVCKSSIRKKI